VPAIAAVGVEAEPEASDQRAVDASACVEHHLLVGRSEVKVRREPPIVAQPALAQARAALEHKAVAIEATHLCEQVQQVILRDVEERGVVRVCSAQRVTLYERSGEVGHPYPLPTSP